MAFKWKTGVAMLMGLLMVSSVSSAPPVSKKPVDAPGSSDEAPEKNPDVEQAVQLLNQGKLNDALAVLQEAARKYPALGPGELQMARIFFSAGRPADGRNYLEQAARANPGSPDVYMTFGHLALSEQRVTDAYAQFELAWRLASGDDKLSDKRRDRYRKDYHAGLTSVAEIRGDWPMAERHLRAWLSLEPNNPKVRLGLARALFFRAEPSDPDAKEKLVRPELELVAQQDTEAEPAAVTLARYWLQAGHRERSLAWMNEAIRAEGNNPSAKVQYAYAEWLFQDGRASDALPYARKAAALDTANKTQARRLLAMLLRHNKDWKAAEELFSTLLRESPADFFLSNQLALCLIEQNDDGKRRRALELAAVNIRQYQKSHEANATLGWCLYRMGRVDEAEPYLQNAVQSGRADPDTAYFFCHLLDARGRLDQARQVLMQVVSTPGPFVFRKEAEEWLARLSPSKKP